LDKTKEIKILNPKDKTCDDYMSQTNFQNQKLTKD